LFHSNRFLIFNELSAVATNRQAQQFVVAFFSLFRHFDINKSRKPSLTKVWQQME